MEKRSELLSNGSCTHEPRSRTHEPRSRTRETH